MMGLRRGIARWKQMGEFELEQKCKQHIKSNNGWQTWQTWLAD